MDDLDGFDERHALNSRLVNDGGRLVEEVYRVGGRYDREIRRIVGHLEDAHRLRAAGHRRGAAGADPLLHHRRRRGPGGLRHRVGARPGGNRGHDQRLHRGLPRPARRQGRVGGPGLLRQSREDPAHRCPGGPRAVVRGSHAVGATTSASPRCWASPPAPSTVVIETGDSGPLTPVGINLPNDQAIRERLRQQVGVARQRQRGLRALDARGPAHRVLVGRGRGRARHPVGRVLARAHDRAARGDRPRLGPDGGARRASPHELLRGALLGASRRRGPISWRCTSCPIRSSSSWALMPAERARRDRADRIRAVHARRPGAAAPRARGRRSSKKTTCATAS